MPSVVVTQRRGVLSNVQRAGLATSLQVIIANRLRDLRDKGKLVFDDVKVSFQDVGPLDTADLMIEIFASDLPFEQEDLERRTDVITSDVRVALVSLDVPCDGKKKIVWVLLAPAAFRVL